MASFEDFDSDCFEPNYEERTFAVRGKIIAHFAKLEKFVEGLIATEFSINPVITAKMQNIIFDRMTFENKRTALNTILLNRSILDGFKPSNKHKHPNKKLLEELQKLNAIRNKFAHYLTCQATDRTEYSKAIGLIESRDSPKTEWFTHDDIDNIVKDIERVKSEINFLIVAYTKSK